MVNSHPNDKDPHSALIQSLSDITTIPRYSIAAFRGGTDQIKEKMGWAARRTTTRVEDVAYSLIGIFDVSMAIMYGEGERAFYRLQLAIAEQTNSTELFLWRAESSEFSSMLAPEPESFLAPDKEIPVELTTDELKQFAPRDIWRLIAAMIEADFEFCKRDLKDNRRRRPRIVEHDTIQAQARDNLRIMLLQGVWPRLLEHMEKETVEQIGPVLLQQMDRDTLRRVGPMWLKEHLILDGLLDDRTRGRLKQNLDVSWIPWGGQQYAMTGAGLAIDVVLYDVQLVADDSNVDPDVPLTVHIAGVSKSLDGPERLIGSQQQPEEGSLTKLALRVIRATKRRFLQKHVLSEGEVDSLPAGDESVQQASSYVTTSEDCFFYAPGDILKLAVLDYYWGDTFHDPDRLRSALKTSYSRVSWRSELDLTPVIAELESRLYRGVFLEPDARGKDCFTRAHTSGNNITLVRRPESGWDQPQRVYIK